MPRIFDNIDNGLLPALRQAIEKSYRADFSVGYFNLVGWRQLDGSISHYNGGDGNCCRLLIGMHRPESDEWRDAISSGDEAALDLETVLTLKRKLAEEFRDQLVRHTPSNDNESGLRRLADQLRQGKLVVKLYLLHPLHAKLYLLFRDDQQNPAIGFVGSSNLTFSGLKGQGELNVDMLDTDGCKKLEEWFEGRWNERWSVDVSRILIDVIEASWARHDRIPPYHIYLKIAYHLSREAQAGLSEFSIPRELKNKLFRFQDAAVRIAARYLNRRGGVLIGDVVGLGKTLMATAIAKVTEDSLGRALIICPKNLEDMWREYCETYDMNAHVLPVTMATRSLKTIRRYRLVIIDESHGLRNRESKRYRAIQNYIAENESKCVLLSATPYNKSLTDLAAQLGLFIPDEADLGLRPERLIRSVGGIAQFRSRFDCAPRTLRAFAESEFPDDWQDLLRKFMIRRTRSFIQKEYGEQDEAGRPYLPLSDGQRSYFPTRLPRTIAFPVDEGDPADQYARLYAADVVDAINALALPRYGLGQYVEKVLPKELTAEQRKQIDDLGRAGKRLMGFCRTNLFKRLESSGGSFAQSIERHVLRNFVFLAALESGDDLPIGPQDASVLDLSAFDTGAADEDTDPVSPTSFAFDGDDEEEIVPNDEETVEAMTDFREDEFQRRAARLYTNWKANLRRRFRWLPAACFKSELKNDLLGDARRLLEVLQRSGSWEAARDAKLQALLDLVGRRHPTEKILVFSQFADTVRYLGKELAARGVSDAVAVTGDTPHLTTSVRRFSPVSNGWDRRLAPGEELRVLIATDVLSEGQNLQDAAIVVNYDLPWAIIRLIQRAGRVDRIGQKAETILCYSFLPADGVESIIRLRSRVRARLHQNAEVIGTDEAFFEDEADRKAREEAERRTVSDLYHEKSGVLDDDAEGETDLASQALHIWTSAIRKDPTLKETVETMPPVVYATRPHAATPDRPDGVLVYLRTAAGNDSLAMIGVDGESVTESQIEILRAAECSPDTPSLERLETHHALVEKAVVRADREEGSGAGALGKPSSARRRVYERLTSWLENNEGSLFDNPDLRSAIDDIYRAPLTQAATDTLNMHLRSGVSDNDLATLVTTLFLDGRLCLAHDEARSLKPQIICSMGLRS